MKYSWHTNYFKTTLVNIARIAEPHVYQGVSMSGWLDWFEKTHPAVYKKFVTLEERMNVLWDQTGETQMGTFKELCQQYEDTHRWVIGEFVKAGG